jgi:hypothetical protein
MYVNINCIGSSNNIHKCEHTCYKTGKSTFLSLPVYAGIHSEPIHFCLSTNVYMVTHIQTVVINPNDTSSSDVACIPITQHLLSAYKHIKFHISNTCAVYVGRTERADIRRIVHS